jgi:hypothetical protein
VGEWRGLFHTRAGAHAYIIPHMDRETCAQRYN